MEGERIDMDEAGSSSIIDENNAAPGDLGEAMRSAAAQLQPKRHKDTGMPRGLNPYRGKRITEKMKAFAALVAKGESAREAYKKAYNVKSNREHAISSNASRLMKDERVVALTRSCWEDSAENLVDDPIAGKRFVMKQLHDHAANEKNSSAVRVKALELMGRAFSMFTDKVEQRTEEVTPQQLKAELEGTLRLLDNVTPLRPRAVDDDDSEAAAG
jgi:hypothetical protein